MSETHKPRTVYASGPEKETHIEVKRMRRFVRRALGAGAVVGAGSALAANALIGGIGHGDKHVSSEPFPKSDRISDLPVEKARAFSTDTIGEGGTVTGTVASDYEKDGEAIDPADIPAVVADVLAVNDLEGHDETIGPDTELKMPRASHGYEYVDHTPGT